MTRLRAFLVHLSLSAVVVGIAFAIVFFIWYPQPYFDVVGAWYLIRILFIVDVVLGPLLTFIVFKPGKAGLKFDLAVIALVQVSALIYGGTIIFQERPYYMVLAVDRFELVPRKDLDLSNIKYDALKEKTWIGTIPVFARLPEDPEALSRFTEEVMFEGKPDLERRTEFWHPYDQFASEAPAQARDLHELLTDDEITAGKAAPLIEKYEADHASLGYLPLLGRTENFAIVLDMETGEQLKVLNVDPYQLIIDRQRSSETESE